jgi:hypothetical protein
MGIQPVAAKSSCSGEFDGGSSRVVRQQGEEPHRHHCLNQGGEELEFCRFEAEQAGQLPGLRDRTEFF